MAFADIIIGMLLFVWGLFKEWIGIFISPLKNLEMLWIIVPIWVNWFFTEFFQEKKGTSLGNAVTNGGIMVWVGIDWIRYMLRMISNNTLKLGWITSLKFLLALVVAVIGIFIVVEGIKTKRFVHFVGRVRETTYIMVMVSPIIYGVVALSWKVLVSIIAFAPLFYYAIELIDRYLPSPKTYREREKTAQSALEKPKI